MLRKLLPRKGKATKPYNELPVNPPTPATSDSRLEDEAIATAVPNTTEGGAGAPTLDGTSAHSRSFSYQQMQSMGLSKAIDEYHRLLETGAQINTPRIPGKPRSSFLSSTLKATVLRPLPTIARPETLIACVGTLWSLISFLIYFTSSITIPLIVWVALGPSTPIQVPKQLTQAIPALRNAQIQPPADYTVRFGIAFTVLVALRAAEVAVSKRAQSRRDAAEAAITPERLESCYAGVRMASASTPSQDWTGVIKEVLTLSQQYEERTTPVRTRADALAWLDRVAKEVGLTIPREAQYAPDTALKAVEQISSSLAQTQYLSKEPYAALLKNEEAFITLLYDDTFSLAVRVLGHSLKKTKTQRDLVVIVAGDVSDDNLAILAADGWRIYRTDTIQNPSLWTQAGGRGFPRKFWGVYTKLMIFNMTTEPFRYKRLVYLDADTVAARNIDELFLCDASLCAVLRHSERFNSGVMVLEPSEETLKDMLNHIQTTPSYTGGDQGFLNEYFSDFASSPLFNPSTSLGQTFSSQTFSSQRKNTSVHTLARLPTIYNADLGLYIANSNRWMLPRDKIGVIHFTFGPFKPWQWYSSWILSENGQYWQSLRAELPVYERGKDGKILHLPGKQQRGTLSASQIFRFLGPWLLSVLMVRRWCWKQGLDACVRCWIGCGTRGKSGSSTPPTSSGKFPVGRLPAATTIANTPFFGFDAVSALAGFASLAISIYISVTFIIPVQIEPVLGWILAYEWISFLTLTVFGSYLGLCYTLGATVSPSLASPRAHMSMYSSKKEDGEAGPVFSCGGRRPWGESLLATFIFTTTLVLLPWWTVGVTSFTGKVIGTAVGGAVSTAIWCQLAIHNSRLWYSSGCIERKTAPPSLLGLSPSLLPILSYGKE